MITPITPDDFEELSQLIACTIRECVADNEADAVFLTDDVVRSLEKWLESEMEGFHAKHMIEGQITGFVLVKKYWNFSHLFVDPRHQKQHIGSTLCRSAIEACREKSPRGKIQLNSSSYAAPFYAAMGFEQTGPGIERAGGCIPFEYRFNGG